MSYPKNPIASDASYSHNTAAMYAASTPQTRVVNQDSQVQGVGYQHQAPAPADQQHMATILNQFQGLALNSSMPTSGAGMTAAHGTIPGTFFTAEQGMNWQPQSNMYPVPTTMTEAMYSGHYPAPNAAQYHPYSFGYATNYPLMPYTPGSAYTPIRSGYYPGFEGGKDVPGLDNRRGSYSTTESAPGTPYYSNLSNRYETGTYIADRSPLYSTPSPHQQLLGVPGPKVSMRKSGDIPIDIDMDALVKQPPAIPEAIPACFTPKESQHTLEQSLSNPIYGNRNVYIRGLHPNTDDETLAAYAARFGRVETTKAIIDTSTGACKGFGFAKYFDVRHSELCIRGFYRLGYEVGFARESFNSRLKAEADSTSTNLYVSNLPKDWNESQLGAVFMEYTVLSSRILRDTQGHSRGVGFARFEDRETCEEVIRKFHGQLVGQEKLVLQVRYADTETQKTLKRVTAERRQFRTNEYNVGAYGGLIHETPIPDGYRSPVYPRLAQVSSHMPGQVQGRQVSRPIHGPNWKRDASSTSLSSAVGGVKLSFPPKTLAKAIAIEKPTPSAASEEEETDNETDDEGTMIQPISPVIAHGTSSAPSTLKK